MSQFYCAILPRGDTPTSLLIIGCHDRYECCVLGDRFGQHCDVHPTGAPRGQDIDTTAASPEKCDGFEGAFVFGHARHDMIAGRAHDALQSQVVRFGGT